MGNFSNPGTRWDHSPRLVYDHDFRTDARGIALPYGIYDPRANRGSIVVGVSHDTPAFAVHAIAHWWRREGLLSYPRSRQLLILADTGGSNNCRYRTWKTELQTQLVNPFHLTVTVAHYPTGASKWNPIEHRLFSEISKNWAGEPLDSYQQILNFIRTTSTKTGPSVSAWTDDATKLKPSLHRNNFACYDSALTLFSPSGTNPLNPVCDFIFASALRSLISERVDRIQ